MRVARLQRRQLLERIVRAAVVDDDDFVRAPAADERGRQLVVERPDVGRLVPDRNDNRQLRSHRDGGSASQIMIPDHVHRFAVFRLWSGQREFACSADDQGIGPLYNVDRPTPAVGPACPRPCGARPRPLWLGAARSRRARRRDLVRTRRPDALALRRQGASRRLAAHPRQPDARLGADRRRVAAAAPPDQHAAGADRLSSIAPGASPSRSRFCPARVAAASIAATVLALTASRTGAALAAAALRAQPQRALSAEHADDRAAAVRADAAAGLPVHAVGPGGTTDGARRCRLDHRAGRASRATKRGRSRARALLASAYAWWRRGHSLRAVAARACAARRLPDLATCCALHGVQPHHGRRVVRQRRVLRARTRRCAASRPRSSRRSPKASNCSAACGCCASPRLAALAVGRLALATAGRAPMLIAAGAVCRRPRCRSPRTCPATRSACATRFPSSSRCAVVVGAWRRPAAAHCAGRRRSRFWPLVVWEHGPTRSAAPMIAEAQLDPNVARARPGDGVPARALSRRHDHDEHGRARPLHAGDVGGRLRDPRLPARGQRPDLGQRVHARPGGAGASGCSSRSSPRAATRSCSATAPIPGSSRISIASARAATSRSTNEETEAQTTQRSVWPIRAPGSRRRMAPLNRH